MRARVDVLAPNLPDIEAAQRHQVIVAVFHVRWHLDFASSFLVGDHLLVVSKSAIPIVVHRCIGNRELVEEGMVCFPTVVVFEQRDGCFVDPTAGVVDEIDLE